jgi:hypothetical protein
MSGETKIKYRYLLTPAKGSSSASTNASVHDPSFDWEGQLPSRGAQRARDES